MIKDKFARSFDFKLKKEMKKYEEEMQDKLKKALS